ncbi:MAG TPA: site-2 protease family protein [Patescibacteria group bacterium]|nr:site-2 protease family protein [Patescibacteria group bacterium]
MTLIVFVLILSILVFVHELGHFLAAKKAGILVEEFGFGLPPRIWGKKVGETIYSINALPIGGFVKLYGEDGPTSSAEEQTSRGRAYFEKSLLQRLSVLLAGVSMNLLLAIAAFSILYFVYGIPTETGKIKVVGIARNSPAEMARLKLDDWVIALDGQKISQTEEFVRLSKEKAGKTVRLEIQREKDNPCQESQQVLGGMASTEATITCKDGNLLVSLIPRENPPEGEGPLGVAISDTEMKKYPWWQMPFLGAREGFKESLSWGGMILGGLKNTVVTLVAKGQVPKDIAGPVGIFQITSEATKNGALAVLQFLGILSVNLAIINILPLPALDGGRLIFLGYEAVTKKKANPKVESWVNTAGMAFLLALMLLITVNDILRLVRR